MKSVLEIFRNVALHPVQTTKSGTGGKFIGGMSTVGALRTRTARPLEMAKAGADVSWFCTECGTEHVKWVGRCTACKEWNTVKEFRTPKSATLDTIDIRAAGSSQKVRRMMAPSLAGGSGEQDGEDGGKGRWLPKGMEDSAMMPMSEVNLDTIAQTIPSFSSEVNRVLGGGIVRGSVVLLAGEPGMGKSTLLLQIAASAVKNSGRKVVYLSGEESSEQIAARAKRLEVDTRDIFLICDIDSDEAIASILEMGDTVNEEGGDCTPALVIVDSIQTMRTGSSTSSLGSVTQTRESAARFVQLAKSTGSAVLLVGHVTKSGEVAGPRILEHMVDTVLYLEGNQGAEAQYRLLRSIKNRFGSTSEVGVLSMDEMGMTDVLNPSELFLSSEMAHLGQEGSAVAVVLEGSRPLLAEIQCLVSAASPRATNVKRMSDGFPQQRLLLICAVIEKRLRLQLWNRDVYVNVAGGLRISEPASDLAVAMTVISSLTERQIRAGTAFVGEVGLGGELRNAKGVEQRVKEAAKLGFKTILVPKASLRGLGSPVKLGLDADTKIVGCVDLSEAMNRALDRQARAGGETADSVIFSPPPHMTAGRWGYGDSDGENEDGRERLPTEGTRSSSRSRSSDYSVRPSAGESQQKVRRDRSNYNDNNGDGDQEVEVEDEEEEDSAQYRVPQFYSPGEDLRREDAAAAAKAAKYRRNKQGYRYSKKK